MRSCQKPLVVVRTLLACSFMLAGVVATAAKDAQVKVEARIEPAAITSGPASIELKPGESQTVTVRVAANITWRLAIAVDNPAIRAEARALTGRPGGHAAPGNTLRVEFTCDPEAEGRQVAAVAYSLVKR